MTKTNVAAKASSPAKCTICGRVEYVPPQHTCDIDDFDTLRSRECEACAIENGDCDGDGGRDDDDYSMFADPGGRSALRAENIIRKYEYSEAGDGSGDESYKETLYCPLHGCHEEVKPNYVACGVCRTDLNIRAHPCPTCGAQNVLTLEDTRLSYQCDRCADRAEGRGVL